MNAPHFRLGLVQTHADETPARNLERTLALIEGAADEGAEIVCTQELFLSRYFCQTEDDAHFALAEPIPSATTNALAALARARGIVIVASLFERRAAGLFHNTAIVLESDGSIAGRYRKMHIPDDPRFFEKYYFTPGDLGFVTIDTSKARLGILICWDQWYPEAARLTAMAGAEVLIYPTAIGTWKGESALQPTQHAAWHTIQRSHAVANGVYVAAINRIGTEDELEFWGRSFCAAPDGSILAEAGADESVLVVTCERAATERARQGWPFFRDRRIDAYGDLTLRWRDDA
ncbi:MAG: carbon-nitrogen hydrolase [Planctomycetota bacterium]|nr:carbon-nitrogen hydrolase [Planctomycetota bacterium]